MTPTPQTEPGDCFNQALEVAMGLDAENLPCKVVHGMPIGNGILNNNKRYWHAWVEVVYQGVPTVLDFANGTRVVMPRDDYYKQGRIKQVYRYTVDGALRSIRKVGHAGPWLPGWQDMVDVIWPADEEIKVND